MSEYNWCHGPSCHKRHTTNRVRGVKGNKVLRTVKITSRHRYGQSGWYEYFCDQTCLMEYINKYIRNIVAIAPCTEALETPINDPVKETIQSNLGNYSWTKTKIEVDESRNIG